MKNAFTVDLEDWFCSHNLKSAIKYEDWDKLESRVEKNTYSILNLLEKSNTKATFFVLGWVSDRFPSLIKDIHTAGHEIASHGYAHQQVTGLNKEEFREDIRKSVASLERIIGKNPIGYRAPAFSITSKNLWAFDILKDQKFVYDSSVYPISIHPEYGIGNIDLSIHKLEQGLLEVPLSCTEGPGNLRIPCSGGAYLRFYPFSFFRYLARKVNAQNRHFIFYIHPWEVDPKPLKVNLPYSRSMRHYFNLKGTLKKIEVLLEEFEFTSIRNLLPNKN
jgi:polysaccharide deacetylase family protein (PEP-CTERM system associated)